MYTQASSDRVEKNSGPQEGKELAERCIRALGGFLQDLPFPIPDSVYESLEQLLDALKDLTP